MEWKCTKCGQIVTSPPLNNDCPKGGNHTWVNAKHNSIRNKTKSKKIETY